MYDGGLDNCIDILEDVGELATAINIVESGVRFKERQKGTGILMESLDLLGQQS